MPWTELNARLSIAQTDENKHRVARQLVFTKPTADKVFETSPGGTGFIDRDDMDGDAILPFCVGLTVEYFGSVRRREDLRKVGDRRALHRSVGFGFRCGWGDG
jgi:hypothetical protein